MAWKSSWANGLQQRAGAPKPVSGVEDLASAGEVLCNQLGTVYRVVMVCAPVVTARVVSDDLLSSVLPEKLAL